MTENLSIEELRYLASMLDKLNTLDEQELRALEPLVYRASEIDKRVIGLRKQTKESHNE
jgi:hypothetical protein